MLERLRSLLAGQAALLLVLLLLTALFSVSLDRFFTFATLRAVLNQIPAITVVSTGMTFVLMTGAIDLSAGSVLALTSACLGLLMTGPALSRQTDQWHRSSGQMSYRC